MRSNLRADDAGVRNVLAESADRSRDDYDRVLGIDLRGTRSCMKFELGQIREGKMMAIQRSGSVSTKSGSATNFTGTVRIDSPFEMTPPGRVAGATVTFEPGARSAWHTHPLGQTLVVIDGVGWTQFEGGPVEEIRAGDVVTCPPGEKHWHGATPTSAMSHVAINEALDGCVVEWFELVTDDEYHAGRTAGHAG